MQTNRRNGSAFPPLTTISTEESEATISIPTTCSTDLRAVFRSTTSLQRLEMGLTVPSDLKALGKGPIDPKNKEVKL